MRKYRKWTEEECARVLELHDQGLSQAKIATHFADRTATSVFNLLDRLLGRTRRQGKTCGDCGIGLTDASRVGYCRSCNFARQKKTKEFEANRLASLREDHRLKAGSLVRRMAGRRGAITRMANPDYRERVIAQIKASQHLSHTPEAHAKRDWAAIGRKISNHYLEWCPEGYRPLYRELMRKAGVKRAEAMQMVLDQIRADEASLSPFERQMRALERGGQLVANDRGASLDRPANYGEGKWE